MKHNQFEVWSKLLTDSLDDMSPTEIISKVKSSEDNNFDTEKIKVSDAIVMDDPQLARNNYIVDLHAAGMTYNTIVSEIKRKAETKWWKPCEERQVKKVILEHYKLRRAVFKGADGSENDRILREAALAQQEQFLEKLIMVYNKHEKNNTFKNVFEQVQLADLISRSRQQLIENRNWNESRKNPLVVSESNTFEVNLYENSGNKMISGTSSAMQNVLEHLRSKFNQDWAETRYLE